MAQQNPHSFSAEQAMAFAASPAGQKLIAMLQKSGSKDLAAAQQHAKAGDMDQARAALSELLKDPQVQSLLKQFGR